MVSWAIALHGGAGMIAKENMTSDWKKRTEAALNEILNIGVVALENNLTAVETVELVVSTNSNLHFTRFLVIYVGLDTSSHNYSQV